MGADAAAAAEQPRPPPDDARSQGKWEDVHVGESRASRPGAQPVQWSVQRELRDSAGAEDDEYRTSACTTLEPRIGPAWQPDISACSICHTGFGCATWRHHCRLCGACACASCTHFVEIDMVVGLPPTLIYDLPCPFWGSQIIHTPTNMSTLM